MTSVGRRHAVASDPCTVDDVAAERLELSGLDRARYFLPTTLCVYLAMLCVVMIVTATFLVSLQNAVAVAAAGLFGLGLSSGLGFIFWRAQRRGLLYTRVPTQVDARTNFAVVEATARHAGWRIVREEPPTRLDAVIPGSLLDVGERVAVRFRGSEVLVASICDPGVGFSLIGQRHCRDHRELVRRAVQCGAATPGA